MAWIRASAGSAGGRMERNACQTANRAECERCGKLDMAAGEAAVFWERQHHAEPCENRRVADDGYRGGERSFQFDTEAAGRLQ